MTRRRLTLFMRCSISEPVPHQPTREEEEADRAAEHERWLVSLDAAKTCRCDVLWSPCEGVLAGGVCDELATDEYEDEAWEMEALP